MNKVICLLTLPVLILLFCGQVQALTITADATGYNVGYVPDFWGVQFQTGTGSIQSVTIDITATGAYFDFDGSPFSTPLIPGVEPVLATMSGLTSADISYPRGTIESPLGHPTSLTFTFSPSSFSAGDWFRFAADVNNQPTTGGEFGTGNVLFQVVMSTGEVYSAPYATVNSLSSVATIEAPGHAVPEPSTLLLLSAGLAGLLGLRRRLN